MSAALAGAAGQLERAVGPVRRRMGVRQLQLQRDGAAAGGRRLRGRQRRARHAPRAGDAPRGAALPPPLEHCHRAAGLGLPIRRTGCSVTTAPLWLSHSQHPAKAPGHLKLHKCPAVPGLAGHWRNPTSHQPGHLTRCNGGRQALAVGGLDRTAGRQLVGPLSAALGALGQLHTLDLHDNRLQARPLPAACRRSLPAHTAGGALGAALMVWKSALHTWYLRNSRLRAQPRWETPHYQFT